MRRAKVRSRRDPADLGFWVERVTGIEPALSAWGIMSRPLESLLHAVEVVRWLPSMPVPCRREQQQPILLIDRRRELSRLRPHRLGMHPPGIMTRHKPVATSTVSSQAGNAVINPEDNGDQIPTRRSLVGGFTRRLRGPQSTFCMCTSSGSRSNSSGSGWGMSSKPRPW